MSMNQQETFNWLVERSNELSAVLAVVESAGIEAPSKSDHRWWVQAEPGPIECDSLAEALKELLDLHEREAKTQRAELSALREQLDAMQRELAGWAKGLLDARYLTSKLEAYREIERIENEIRAATTTSTSESEDSKS